MPKKEAAVKEPELPPPAPKPSEFSPWCGDQRPAGADAEEAVREPLGDFKRDYLYACKQLHVRPFRSDVSPHPQLLRRIRRRMTQAEQRRYERAKQRQGGEDARAEGRAAGGSIELDAFDLTDPADAVTIRGAVCDIGTLSALAWCLPNCPTVQTIRLWHAGLTRETLQALVQLLRHPSSAIRRLEIDYCDIQRPISDQEAELGLEKPTAEVAEEDVTGFVEEKEDDEGEGDEEDAIPTPRQPTDEGEEDGGEAREEESVAALVAQLLEAETKLEHVSLRGNFLGPEVGRAVGPALARARHLRSLCLADNKLGDEGVRHLARGLRENRGLRELSVASNGLTAEGAACIAEACTLFVLATSEAEERRRWAAEIGLDAGAPLEAPAAGEGKKPKDAKDKGGAAAKGGKGAKGSAGAGEAADGPSALPPLEPWPRPDPFPRPSASPAGSGSASASGAVEETWWRGRGAADLRLLDVSGNFWGSEGTRRLADALAPPAWIEAQEAWGAYAAASAAAAAGGGAGGGGGASARKGGRRGSVKPAAGAGGGGEEESDAGRKTLPSSLKVLLARRTGEGGWKRLDGRTAAEAGGRMARVGLQVVWG